jgi:hypothetical protein
MGDWHHGHCSICTCEADVTYTHEGSYGVFMCAACLEREGEEIVAGLPFTD